MKKYFVCRGHTAEECFPIREGVETLDDAVRIKREESSPKDGDGYFDLSIFKSEDGKSFEELSYKEIFRVELLDQFLHLEEKELQYENRI